VSLRCYLHLQTQHRIKRSNVGVCELAVLPSPSNATSYQTESMCAWAASSGPFYLAMVLYKNICIVLRRMAFVEVMPQPCGWAERSNVGELAALPSPSNATSYQTESICAWSASSGPLSLYLAKVLYKHICTALTDGVRRRKSWEVQYSIDFSSSVTFRALRLDFSVCLGNILSKIRKIVELLYHSFYCIFYASRRFVKGANFCVGGND